MRGVIFALGILVICAAVSYSFEDLTGFFIQEGVTSIVITGTSYTDDGTPSVPQGTPITVVINTGDKGAKRYFTVHRYPSNARKGTKNWCATAGGTWLSEKFSQSFKCKGIKSVNYGTVSIPPGRYYIRIFDYQLYERDKSYPYVTEEFEVIEKPNWFK